MKTCKWPIGDPRKADFHFCDQAAEEGRPYCNEHSRQARSTNTYTPSEVKRWTQRTEHMARRMFR